jgi:hypothetical protein
MICVCGHSMDKHDTHGNCLACPCITFEPAQEEPDHG